MIRPVGRAPGCWPATCEPSLETRPRSGQRPVEPEREGAGQIHASSSVTGHVGIRLMRRAVMAMRTEQDDLYTSRDRRLRLRSGKYSTLGSLTFRNASPAA